MDKFRLAVIINCGIILPMNIHLVSREQVKFSRVISFMNFVKPIKVNISVWENMIV